MSTKIVRPITTLLLACIISACATLEDTRRPTIDAQSNFDLAEYLFHDQVLTSGNELVATESIYRKSNHEQIEVRSNFLYLNDAGTIRVADSPSNKPITQYVITPQNIEEQRPESNETRVYKRTARLGDVYLDTISSTQLMSETCELLEYFDSYNLASATGANVISRNTYKNVIKTRCESNFLDENNRRNNFRWNLYYAKGIGLVFKDGNWTEKMGLIYGLYDY